MDKDGQDERDSGEDGGEDAAIELASLPAAPEAAWIGAEDESSIPEVVRTADKRAQAIVMLRSMGWSNSQVAGALGVTVQAVGASLARRGLQSFCLPPAVVRGAQMSRLLGMADCAISTIDYAELRSIPPKDRAFIARAAVDCAASLAKLAREEAFRGESGTARCAIKRAEGVILGLLQQPTVATQPAIDAITAEDAGG
jgi:hypothetical protein